MENITELIKSKYEIFSKSEKKIAKYYLDNFDEAVLLSSSEVAEKLNVSDTTIIRFTKTLGYSGFFQFKKNLKEIKSLNANNSPYDNLKKMSESTLNQSSLNYIQNMSSNLTNFLERVTTDTINDIASSILKAKKIYLLGIGSDTTVATFLFVYLRKIGLDVININETGFLLREKLVQVSSDDLMILTGFPRYLSDEENAAKFIKSRGAKLITISNSRSTDMVFDGDISVVINDSTDKYFNSYVLPLMLCDLILIAIYEKEPEIIESKLKDYVDVVGNKDWI